MSIIRACSLCAPTADVPEQHEQQYIEACQSANLLHSFQPGKAEVWRMAYHTPAPSTDRTFVELLLSREIRTEPRGRRAFLTGT